MTKEFKYQVLKTADQWNSGLPYRSRMMDGGGITLYSTPAFRHWLSAVKEIADTGVLAVDQCGQLYIVDNTTCRIYVYDPRTDSLLQLPCLDLCKNRGEGGGDFIRMIIRRFTMWILDKRENNIKGLSRENFQVKYTIEPPEAPVDFAVDHAGFLYVLTTKGIYKYTYNGSFVESFGQAQLADPVGLVVGRDNILNVINGQAEEFFTFSAGGLYLGTIGDFSQIPGTGGTIQNAVLRTDKKGNLYIGDSDTGNVYQFDADGSYIGTFSIPNFSGAVLDIGFDPSNNFYVATPSGIAFFSLKQTYSQEKGLYYSQTLDSGIEHCQWHRLKLELDLPKRTLVKVYYYASDDEALKALIETCPAADGTSVQQKAQCIDDLIQWKGPETNPEDMLFQEGAGRYLWFKLELSTFEETLRPSVTDVRIFYPRLSYLRYLPAIYQEDPSSGEFLERFLSLFESQFYDLETHIEHIFQYLDPDTTPADFLKWLGSWLNLALEEEWEEDQKRTLIREAAALYKQKGTPGGLTRLIEIYTGTTPVILEHMRAVRPIILNKKFRLGIDTILIRTPVRGFRLGDDSILGRTALRDEALSPQDPFLPLAHRFTVLMDLDRSQYNRLQAGVKRLLEEEKPAHTQYTLRNTGQLRIGMDTYVGINTKVSDYRAMRLSIDSVPGTGLIVFDKGEPAGKLESRSRIKKDLRLI
ncbi:MAG: hypothetical protein GY765_10100 [bacterium]|nr:hypothetical protein [bacterium]